MTYKICEWDSTLGKQVERDATPEEASEIEARNTATPPVVTPEVPLVPQRVPMLNAHLVLIDAGLMDSVQAYINAIPGPDGARARAYFNLALTMERTHPLVLGIPAALGKTEAQVDALFVVAGAMHV